MPLYKVLPHNMPATLLDCGWPLPTPEGPGDWMPAVEGELVLFENGYDLCRPQDLVRCLGPTMFEAEFQGDSLECEHRLQVRQARLIRSVERWTQRTAVLFAADCAERVVPLYESRRTGQSWPRDALAMARRSICGETNVVQMTGASNLAKAVKDAEAVARKDPVTYAVWKAIRWTCYAAIWDRAPHAARFAREAVEAAAGEDREAALLAELAWQTGRLFEYPRRRAAGRATTRSSGCSASGRRRHRGRSNQPPARRRDQGLKSTRKRASRTSLPLP
jgi:hypothetical protein